MSKNIKNIDRDNENLLYAEKLMRFADEGGEFRNHNGDWVSADIRVRMAGGVSQALNATELEFMELDPNVRDEFMNLFRARIDKLIAYGSHTNYALGTIVGYLRYESDTSNERGLIFNDHHKTYAARLLNYSYRNIFTLKVKGVKNEVIKKPQSSSEPMLPSYFLKVM